jgi:hypothetical protein
MTDAPDHLTPATPDDLADALAFAQRFDGRRRKHDAAEMMAAIVVKRLVEHLAGSSRSSPRPLVAGPRRRDAAALYPIPPLTVSTRR